MLCWCYATFFFHLLDYVLHLLNCIVRFLFIHVFIFLFCYTKSLWHCCLTEHPRTYPLQIRRFAGLTLLNLTVILHGQHASVTDFSSALLFFQIHSSLVTQHKKDRRIFKSQHN